ncbi:lipase member I isoform X1 [Microplitis demolitor]|uniref:lipase member I isoform X1 n=2 Tax=Microplitis demolitor TaxID=69319 RepID=UPI0004CD5D8F|nr:lipase member I isoform X1 [Microplitis demolitor]
MDILYVLLVIGVLIEPIVAHKFLKRSIFDMLTNNRVDNQLKYILEENNHLMAKIKIKIYTGSSIESATITDIPINEPDIIYQNIDNSKPLAMYIHGYREHPSNESIQTVIGAYLDRGTDNILLVDWSDLSFDNYIILIQKIKDMARILSDTINSLVELGLDLENFHLIGHSMGAQMAGFIGRYTKYELPRITGLDPASPGFYYARAEHINNKSARFVDILHTDGGFYGALDNTGTADFFPNGGKRPQPGCPILGIPLTPTDLCNHWRSWRIYAESIKNIFSFPAVQCSSYLDYTEGRCEKNQVIYFGYSTPTNARGSYFFKTNDKSPYGRSL